MSLISTDYYRELEINDRISQKRRHEKPIDFFKTFILTKKKKRSEFNYKLDLRGLGISIVDKEPKEVIYMSLYRIKINYSSESAEKDNGVTEISQEVDMILYHMQIDNMVSMENPILFTPMEILDKDKILIDEEYTPFIQVKVSSTNNKSSKVSRKKVDALQIMIQKMKMEIETGTLNVILGTINEINTAYYDQGTEYLSAQTTSTNQKLTLIKEASSSSQLRHRSLKGRQDSVPLNDSGKLEKLQTIKEFK